MKICIISASNKRRKGETNDYLGVHSDFDWGILSI